TYYRVLVSATGNDCAQIVSNVSTADIVSDMVIFSQPENIDECIGGTEQLSISLIGGTGTITYQWEMSPNGTDSWTNASGPGSDTDTYTPPSTSAGTTYYRVVISATGNGCGQTISTTATVIVREDLAVLTHPGNISECIGGTDQLTITITGGSGT